MISPSYAGMFYEKEYVPLMKQLDSAYKHKLGPGDLPTRRKEEKIHGIIVPHEHYSLSGPCAAWAYKLLAEHKFPQTFLLLVPDQTGNLLNYATCLEDFETAFGICKCDQEVAKALIDSGIVTQKDVIVEQALEMQLPFLMHACKDKINDIKIVPIVVPHTNNVENLAKEIYKLNKELLVIMTSNFTMFGPKFMFTPFKYNVEKSLENLDLSMMKLMVNLDSDLFLKFVKKNKLQVRGSCAIVLGLELLSLMGVDEGELLSYYKSSELTKDEENSISFMSLVFS